MDAVGFILVAAVTGFGGGTLRDLLLGRLPVVWLQLRLAKIAREADEQNEALPETYWRYARYWEGLGYPAFVAMLGVYFLMVMKPDL